MYVLSCLRASSLLQCVSTLPKKAFGVRYLKMFFSHPKITSLPTHVGRIICLLLHCNLYSRKSGVGEFVERGNLIVIYDDRAYLFHNFCALTVNTNLSSLCMTASEVSPGIGKPIRITLTCCLEKLPDWK